MVAPPLFVPMMLITTAANRRNQRPLRPLLNSETQPLAGIWNMKCTVLPNVSGDNVIRPALNYLQARIANACTSSSIQYCMERCNSGIVVRRYECSKLADRWPTAVGGHDCLSRLLDVHARLICFCHYIRPLHVYKIMLFCIDIFVVQSRESKMRGILASQGCQLFDTTSVTVNMILCKRPSSLIKMRGVLCTSYFVRINSA